MNIILSAEAADGGEPEYVEQHALDAVEVRQLRPRYTEKAAFNAYLAIRDGITKRYALGVEPGQHRADEGGQ